ncbi:MAG TPA: hypothetical protein VMJ10_13375 [Kofleriaceae bacterium]|nr:hypothetical protein [Kofleriaceae bacterium]
MRLALVLVLAACGHAAAPAATPAPATSGDPTCPVEVPATSVTVEDTATGGALVFVTTGDVAELRARCAKFAMVHADRSVENIDRGARVVDSAKRADVGALQSELRMHAEHLANGSCQMVM